MTADHRTHMLDGVRSVFSILLYPLQTIASTPTDLGNWLSEQFTSQQSLIEENQQYHSENLLLKAQLQKFASLQAENIRLRSLLKSSRKLRDQMLIAETIAVDLPLPDEKTDFDLKGIPKTFLMTDEKYLSKTFEKEVYNGYADGTLLNILKEKGYILVGAPDLETRKIIYEKKMPFYMIGHSNNSVRVYRRPNVSSTLTQETYGSIDIPVLFHNLLLAAANFIKISKGGYTFAR